MALYLGKDKVKINLDGVAYCLNLPITTFVINGVKLLSSDDCVLKDKNGLYVTAKESV